nr:MAG TPA: hypothetical protein [Caudoviricetes sp.]
MDTIIGNFVMIKEWVFSPRYPYIPRDDNKCLLEGSKFVLLG